MPFSGIPAIQGDLVYEHGPDSFVRRDVPAGVTTELTLDHSTSYPGTRRRVWVHVPHGVDPAAPAPVMVFNDGWWYLDPEGDVRGGIVLDNLVHAGQIPAMIGVFVDPGVFDPPHEPKNRNTEYDAFDARYADFLTTEVLPLVEQRWNLSDDLEQRGICGGSSGGNAAFTAAWQRPDVFAKVIAFNSSFAQMPGGNPYPPLLAAESAKPLRIFLQAAHRDLNWNQPTDNWLAESLRVGAALAEAGYDFRLVVGDGGHSPNHGGVLLPDALRWTWRTAASRHPAMADELVAGELTLRVLTSGDADALHAIFSDPATHTIGNGPISDIEGTRDWLRGRDERRRQHGVTWYGAWRADGTLIGNAGLFMGRTGDEPEIGFEIRSVDQGRGHGGKVAAAVVHEAHRAGFARVWATVRPSNVGSLRALARIGFVHDHDETDDRGDLVCLVHESGGQIC